MYAYKAVVSLLQGIVPITSCRGFLPILGQMDADQIRLGISGLLDQARIPRLEVKSDLSPADISSFPMNITLW